jgi:hypothetical protein
MPPYPYNRAGAENFLYISWKYSHSVYTPHHVMESLFLSSIQPLTLTQDTGSVSVSISRQLDQRILCLKITVAVAVACAERLSIHMR